MKNQIVKIELITELGIFTFANKHTSTADFYQSMLLFEGNNWKILGITSYKTYTEWEDGEVTEDTYKGINASAYLASNFDEDLEKEIANFYESQHC